MLSIVITVVHILACLFLVLVVLLQTGKGAEMGAVFGGSSSTVFGSSGAGNFLTRLTTAIAVVFMLTSLSLTYLGSRGAPETVFDSSPAELPAPAVPGAAVPEEAEPIAAEEDAAETLPAPAPVAEEGEESPTNAGASASGEIPQPEQVAE